MEKPVKHKKLIIVGASAFAEIAYEYFDSDSPYEVVAFAVEEAFLDSTDKFGLPLVALETIEQRFSIAEHDVFVAATYTQLNRLRARLAHIAKAKGYKLASYISSRAFIWRNVVIGEHCFIFEDNTVQPFVTLGNNVVLWSGNHIGHHSKIGDNCFISSHVVVSGFCNIGENTFLGVNCTLANNVVIGKDNWVGPGITLTQNTEPNALFGAVSPDPSRVSALRFFKVKE
jgi:sugar O-acyltransferase (sialic acid O-acetyltransferase NeuD family)